MLEAFRALVNGGADWAVQSAPSPALLAGLALVTALAAYFLGCSNGAILVSKYLLHNDIRTHGSGNAGLTNFHRVFGGKLTLVVILTDVVKAVLAVGFGLLAIWLAGWPGLDPLVRYWCGLFCLLGHMFPCMFSFRGGKGILSGGTIALMLDPRIALVVWGGFLILVFLTRWVSLGSCWAAASFPFATWFVYQDVLLLVLAVVIGGLILWQHRTNIVRLVQGKENKLTFHKKNETGV